MDWHFFARFLLIACLFAAPTSPTEAKSQDQAQQERLTESLKRADRMAEQVKIHRDSLGVPHVFGPTDASVVFGFTYARAEDEFQKIQQSLLSATGRLSELHGPTSFLADRAVRLFEIPGHAKREFEDCDPDFKKIITAYADALNFYVSRHPDVEPVVIQCFEPWHALAAGRTMNIAMLTLSPEYKDLLEAADSATTNAVTSETEEATNNSNLEQPKPENERDGSNMWAIAPHRTTTGNAMLFINPHIPLNQLYEGHMCSEEGLNVSGGFAYGSFLFPFAGHNEKLAWSLTVNYPDVIDVFIDEFDPENPARYRVDDNWHDAVQWKDSVKVKVADDQLNSIPIDCWKTKHGPVFFRVRDQGYVVNAPKLVEGGLPQQLYRMSKAADHEQFKAAIGTCSLVFHNVMYADVSGNIWYVYNSATRKRDASVAWDKPVSGSTSKTDYGDYHQIDEMPQVLNPACGWMQNCNSSPFSTSANKQNPDRKKFPNYIARDDRDNNRVRISKAILARNEKFSFEDLESLAWDTRVLEAEKWVPFLCKAIEGSDRSKELKALVNELRQWNQRVTTDSIASTIFHLWYEKTRGKIRGQGLDNKTANDALATVLTELEADFGSWRVRYGDLFRHQRPNSKGEFSDDGLSWATAGGDPRAGMVFTFLSRKVGESKKRYGFHGHSYVSVVELNPDGIKAKSLIPYGQSSDPKSKHYLDQAEMYAQGKFKPALFEKQEILQGATVSYRPGDLPRSPKAK